MFVHEQKIECKTDIFKTYYSNTLHTIDPTLYAGTTQHWHIRTGKIISLNYFHSTWEEKIWCIELKLLEQNHVAITSFSSHESTFKKRHEGEVTWVRLLRTYHFEGSTIQSQSTMPIRLFIWLCGCIVSKHPFPRWAKMQYLNWERLE